MKHIGYMLVGIFSGLIPAASIVLFPGVSFLILGFLFMLFGCYCLGKSIVEDFQERGINYEIYCNPVYLFKPFRLLLSVC